MSDHLRTLVEGWLEKFAGKFLLASFVNVLKVLVPHIGDENDIPQRRFPAELAEQVEIPSSDSAEPIVGDAVDVDDPSECGSLLVSVEEFSSEDWGTVGASNTYVAARKSAIIFKISVSLFEVSSNPGVSMRVTTLLSRVNLSASWT